MERRGQGKIAEGARDGRRESGKSSCPQKRVTVRPRSNGEGTFKKRIKPEEGTGEGSGEERGIYSGGGEETFLL